MPAGVQGRNTLPPVTTAPTFCGWKQSTSFSGEMRRISSSESMCSGTGSWQSMPLTELSRLSLSMSSISSSCAVCAGSANSSDFMPTFSQLFFLLLTYTLEAGSSPTIMTARHGSTPQLFRYSTRSRTESSTSAEISFPSISFAILSTLSN